MEVDDDEELDEQDQMYVDLLQQARWDITKKNTIQILKADNWLRTVTDLENCDEGRTLEDHKNVTW